MIFIQLEWDAWRDIRRRKREPARGGDARALGDNDWVRRQERAFVAFAWWVPGAVRGAAPSVWRRDDAIAGTRADAAYSGDVRAMWGWGTMRVGGIGDLRGLGDAGSPGATGGVFSACDAKGLNASASRCCGLLAQTFEIFQRF